MAVVSCEEQHQQRRSSYDAEKDVWTHTRVWLVICDDPKDGTAVAARAPGLPPPQSLNDQHETTKLTGLDSNPVDNSDVVFAVIATFTTPDFGGEQSDPLQRRPKISYGGQEFTEAYFKDRSPQKKLVVNSAGDPFTSDAERDDGKWAMKITTNNDVFSPVDLDPFKFTTNEAEVEIDGTRYAPDTLPARAPDGGEGHRAGGRRHRDRRDDHLLRDHLAAPRAAAGVARQAARRGDAGTDPAAGWQIDPAIGQLAAPKLKPIFVNGTMVMTPCRSRRYSQGPWRR